MSNVAMVFSLDIPWAAELATAAHHKGCVADLGKIPGFVGASLVSTASIERPEEHRLITVWKSQGALRTALGRRPRARIARYYPKAEVVAERVDALEPEVCVAQTGSVQSAA